MTEETPKLTRKEIDRIARAEASGKTETDHTFTERRDEEQYRQAMKENAPYLTLGLQMAMTMVLGAGIGWWYSNKTGNSLWLGLGAGIGAVLGMTYFIIVVLRSEKKK